MKKKILWLLVIVFSGLFLFSGYRIVTIINSYKQEKETYKTAEETYTKRKDGKKIDTEEASIPYFSDMFRFYDPFFAREEMESDAWKALLRRMKEREKALSEDTDDPEELKKKQEAYRTDFDIPSDLPVYPSPGESPLYIDWPALHRVNTDIMGWVYVEALPQISYPILQGPNDAYYVHLTYDLKPSNAGCIFMSYLCRPDFSTPHTLIFGHNINNGTMFSPLYAHRGDGTFVNNPYIWIMTEKADYCYQIFSIFEVPRNSEAFMIHHSSNEAFADFAKTLLARGSWYRNTSVSLDKDDHVISLVCCVPNTYNRCVLSAVRVKEVKN